MITQSSIRLFISQRREHEERALTEQWRAAAADSGGEAPDDACLRPDVEHLRDLDRTENHL